jgi:hypothetical protein
MSVVALERTGRGNRPPVLGDLICLSFIRVSRPTSNNTFSEVPEPKKDWEDECRRLREEHKALKQLCNEQEDHIRRYSLIHSSNDAYYHLNGLFIKDCNQRHENWKVI